MLKDTLRTITGITPPVDALLRLRRTIEVPALDLLFQREVGADLLKGRRWRMESYCFTYKSKSAKGEDVVLSGRVTFPCPRRSSPTWSTTNSTWNTNCQRATTPCV